MITYKAKECRCWREYPNPMQKKSNGQWKCIDCYELVRNGNWRTHKTICKLKGADEEGSDAE